MLLPMHIIYSVLYLQECKQRRNISAKLGKDGSSCGKKTLFTVCGRKKGNSKDMY
jgi:hypothetical protein